MIGAIIGDIVGSVYEWHNIKTKDFPLFRDDCFFTDDTVMTCAVAEALMNGGTKNDFIDAMKKYGGMYPNADYGGHFGAWVNSDNREPINSWGNGSAMRVSPVGFFVELSGDMTATTGIVRTYAQRSAEVTHNHPYGVKGAQAVAESILFMRYAKHNNADINEQKLALKRYITEQYEYDLTRTLDEIRPTYRFDESCQGTVPEAICAFLESTDYEDAIRNAISLGGDSDTLAAITGGIAEAAYGIPQWILDKAWCCLDEPLRAVCRKWRVTVQI